MKVNISIRLILLAVPLLVLSACHDLLDEPAENRAFTEQTDYTISDNMILPLIGMYADFYDHEWENFPLLSVRGDDVNAGGLGDQQDYANTDNFSYNKDYWMYNSLWQNYYGDIFNAHSAMDQIGKYKEYATNKALADQYIAEVKVMRSFYLFHLARVWGEILIPESFDPSALLVADLKNKDEVMNHIVAQMGEAIPDLPSMHPNERTDIKGGITKYTALAIQALANLELKNYQGVADATSQIISSGEYALEPDYYNLFKIPGKLNRENLLEFQYSDFGSGTGTNKAYLYAFFGPQGWTPKVTGAGDGWGFYEPSLKYIKFMLGRGETVRLETSVIFTNRGIAKIKEDPNYATLPAWITNTTRSGDRFNDYARAMFASGKHYLPSDQLTPGRTDYGTNKNFTCIRYAEILLMHAEALSRGATSSSLSAVAAVNLVRQRAGLSQLASVTADAVMDEKYAELAMEWGTRYFDMVRLGNTGALSYDGRTFSVDKTFLPYPQNQVDLLPPLQGK
ncbi:MAG: RagB/SusD family nutrient uptake outer membrane protein [Bacteroidales bacterium]|nr:RagB/SusD family nutrient uptake outer membrane protein [Bacteroidales bacterium]